MSAASSTPAAAGTVLAVEDVGIGVCARLLAGFGLEVVEVAAGQPIPGSYWGDAEAGLIGDRLYCRADTPVHSLLHEACHFICMDAARRSVLERDAGGDYAEEDAVCCLQILLADQLPGVGRARLCADMDAWGYTFRLGSAAAWFARDSAETRVWLHAHGILDAAGGLTWRIRRDV